MIYLLFKETCHAFYLRKIKIFFSPRLLERNSFALRIIICIYFFQK